MRTIVIPKVPDGYIKNLCGTLSVSGTYASNFSGRTKYWGCDDAGHVVIVMQGANTTSYENIRYSLVSSVGSIVLLSNYTGNFSASNPVGGMYGCVLTNVDAPINVDVAMNTQDATYDFHLAEITVTYA